jgi:hypothetical protein
VYSHWLDAANKRFGREFINDVKSALNVMWLFLPLPIFWTLFGECGHLCPWSSLSMAICVHGHLCPWSSVSMSICVHGHLFQWQYVSMAICVYVHLCPWPSVSMAICVHSTSHSHPCATNRTICS